MMGRFVDKDGSGDVRPGEDRSMVGVSRGLIAPGKEKFHALTP